MLIDSWLQYIDKCFKKNELTFNSICKFLKRSKLTAYINNYLSCKSYAEIAENLKEKFIKINIPFFSKISHRKLYFKSQLKEYIHKNLN